MSAIADAASWLFVLSGCFFVLIGALGMLRLPDFYTRIHAAGMTDSLGAPLILVGLMLQSGWSLVTLKLLTVWVFLWVSSPSSSHAVAKAAFARGLRVAVSGGNTPAPEALGRAPNESSSTERGQQS